MNQVSVSPRLIAAIIVVLLLSWGLYASIEFYDDRVESGWTAEARHNPYLAAQQFITQSGIEVSDADSLIGLDALDGAGTLFISESNQVTNSRQLAQVMAWLERGGSVIYTADSVAHGDDLLLQEFDVEVDWRDDEDEDQEETPLSERIRDYNRQIEEGKTREEIAGSFGSETSLTLVEFGDDIGDLEIEFDDRKVLIHPYISGSDHDSTRPQPFSWSFSDYGVHMMQFEVGDGLLTIVTDPGIWTSYRIDEYDHAYLLWILSSGEGDFAFLRPVLGDMIDTLILRNASELLIAAALLILIWIWHMGSRFGRLVPRDRSRTRALAEHFSSISHYLWHRRDGEYLITPLRQRVLRRASLGIADFSRAEPAEQMELLAQRCDLNADAITRALQDNDFNETTFVQKVKLLKRIEQSL